LKHYNFEVHLRDIAEKVRNQMVLELIFPPYLTSASALPGKTVKFKKLHLFFHMLYYYIARLQAVASLIYSVLLLTSHNSC